MRTASIAALIAACVLAGCTTTSDWRTGFGLFSSERSCANGYYDCSLRTSDDEGDRHKSTQQR